MEYIKYDEYLVEVVEVAGGGEETDQNLFELFIEKDDSRPFTYLIPLLEEWEAPPEEDVSDYEKPLFIQRVAMSETGQL